MTVLTIHSIGDGCNCSVRTEIFCGMSNEFMAIQYQLRCRIVAERSKRGACQPGVGIPVAITVCVDGVSFTSCSTAKPTAMKISMGNQLERSVFNFVT